MADESNQEHQLAARNGPSTESRVDSAGRLSALLLISDKAGYSLDVHGPPEDCIPRDPCGHEDPEELRAAVSSKLFRADSEQCFGPVHRQIAEFLGARHLARLIADGLSPRRVLALMTGGDGVAVTALRGLSAWLATYSEAVRAELISKNPVDLGVYGDLGAFSGDDKGRVLEALLAQPMNLSRALLQPKRFCPLAASETESRIRKTLSSEERGPNQEVRVRFLSLLLSSGEPLPGLEDLILTIVRDGSWSTQVRANALSAIVRYQQGWPQGHENLNALLGEFRAEGISIANRDLCGILLRALYPKTVGPRQVWDYFSPFGGPNSWGQYLDFWRRELVASSTVNGIAELLDTLAAASSRLEPTIDDLRLWDLPLEMLHKGLRLHGESVDIDRVSGWLRTCAGAAEGRSSNPPESLLGIRSWLESHPAVQKQVILAGLEACPDSSNLGQVDYENRKRLLGAKLPSDFGRWCLTRAVTLAATKPEAAKHLLLEAYRALGTSGVSEGLSLEVLQEQVRGHAPLDGILAQLQAPPPIQQDEEPWRQQAAVYDDEQERERNQLLEIVRLHASRLLENRAHPELLYQLALVYFGEVPSVATGLRGAGAITQALRHPDAVAAAMHGLRHCLDRDDLPNVREIIRLARNNTEHYISLPLLAGLDELQESAPGFPLHLAESRLRTCVACLHCWEPHSWKSNMPIPPGTRPCLTIGRRSCRTLRPSAPPVRFVGTG